jgi:uncharacterized membrane protein
MNIDFKKQIAAKGDEELLHIFANADEYQKDYVDVVSNELNKRNINTDSIKIQRQHKEKFTQEQFEKGKEGNEIYIAIGFITAFLGGLIGIIAGYVYSQSKRKDNSGTEYYAYNKQTRNKGRIMMIVGFFALVLISLWKLS